MKTNANSKMVIVSVLGLLALWGSAWGGEGSESIQGLIAHWKLDEDSGTTAYDSAGDNDGTIYGAVWTTGQIDGALDFDGVDDYVSLSENVVTTTEFTLMAWANHYGRGGGREQQNVIFQQRDDRTGDNRSCITLYSETYGDAKAIIRSSNGTEQQLADTKRNYYEWHHYSMTVNSDDFIFYIDGVEVDRQTNNQNGNYVTSIDYVDIGRHRYGNIDFGFFNGLIDDVRIYDRALSAEEVGQLYKDGLGELVGLEIVGPNEVAENFSASYKAIAYYDNNSTRDVTDSALWAVEPNMAANIDGNGILTTKDVVREQAATILASYTGGDVTVEAEKAIDIFAICPTGTALQFDGVDDYVDCGNLGSFPSTGTIGFWMKPYEIANYRNPFTTDFAGRNAGIRFEESDPGRFVVVIRTPGFPSDPGVHEYVSSGLQAGRWYHVVLTWDSANNNVRGYLNGVEKFNENHTNIWPTALPDVQIGRGYSTSSNRYWDGVVDEVRIYDRALSAEEIQANMHTRLAGDEPNLVGYWDFDEGEGQIVYDLSGNGNDGQLGSTPSPDVSDPAWVDSDAPIGLCTPYLIATMPTERAVERKLALIEELLATLAQEWEVREALEEWLESGDYGDLKKGDIVTAKQKIHSAIQHEEQAIDALEKSIEKLEDALSALGYEPEDR